MPLRNVLRERGRLREADEMGFAQAGGEPGNDGLAKKKLAAAGAGASFLFEERDARGRPATGLVLGR